ncbi:hypothetical protein AKJ09_00727 [Labilithrix luteola]|uniref:PEGA domain-containing protein n=1 Tax=Labilithrix luteola TaxID=1391654 RepID=A0A0K1PKJ9_9BACT|nr:hypothetical protein [Labilithrix luteola]AKU94063.1 hypothetical protein AKJ09_00727 [Labilithrix luteola]
MSFLDRSPRISISISISIRPPEPRSRTSRLRLRALAGWMALGAFLAGNTASAANPPDERAECAKLAEDAQAQRTAGKMRAALESLSMCARESCPLVIRRDCTSWVDEVERVVPTMVVHATDARGQDVASVKVYADGTLIKEQLDGRAISMDPGVHKLRFVVSGASAVERDVLLAESQKNRLVELRFDRALRLDGTADGDTSPTSASGAPSASSTPVLPWVFMGIGALSLATFGVLEVVGHGEYDDLESTCGKTRTCTDDQLSPTRTKFVAAAVALGVGLVGIGTGGVMLLTRPKNDERGVVVGAAPTDGGGMMRLRGTF